jgi:hypothetical protein
LNPIAENFLLVTRLVSVLSQKIRHSFLDLKKFKVIDLRFAGRPYPATVKRICQYAPAIIIQSKGVIEDRPVVHAFAVRDVFEILDANVDLKMGEVYLNTREFLVQSSPWHPYRPSPDRRWKRPKLTLENPGGFIRLPAWTYYHQIVENLPPYLYLRQKFPDAITLLPSKDSVIARKILDDLGFEYVCHESQVRVNKLYIVGQGPDSGFPHPTDVEQLTSTLGEAQDTLLGQEIIYVSRLKSSRSFTNEMDLVDRLIQLPGVRILESESLNFLDQIRFFSKASVIVGAHGAGLTNQLWMKPGSLVVEILDREYANPVFETLATVLRHKHETLFLSKHNGGKFVDIDSVVSAIGRDFHS